MSDSQPHPTPFEAKPNEERSDKAADITSRSTSTSSSRDTKSSEPNKLLAGCSYLGVLFLIPLLAESKDDFVKFHLRQGVVLFMLGVVASFGFHYRRGGSMLMLVVIVISLVAAFRAWRGDRWQLPIIGKYAAKIEL